MLSDREINDIGRIGEQTARKIIKEVWKPEELMQLDWMFKHKGNYYLVEVKHQEFFSAPPFDGHGLPRWQVRARINFFEETGIRPILLIIEKPLKAVYVQYLDKLNKGNYHDTRGSKPRRIYPLSDFENITDQVKEHKLI